MERLEGKVVFPVETKEPVNIHWIIGKGYAPKEEVARLQDGVTRRVMRHDSQ